MDLEPGQMAGVFCGGLTNTPALAAATEFITNSGIGDARDPALTGRTRIIDKSPPFGIPPVVVHPALPVEQKEQLRKAFLTLHQDTEAALLLKHLQIDRFVIGDDDAYNTVHEMRRWVEDFEKGVQ